MYDFGAIRSIFPESKRKRFPAEIKSFLLITPDEMYFYLTRSTPLSEAHKS